MSTDADSNDPDEMREATQAAGSEQAVDERAAVEQADDPLVVVDGLRTYYGSDQLFGGDPVKAVDGVSFEIGHGETLGIVGESGCGKTTLGRSMLRLETVNDGRVEFNGTDVTELGRRDLKDWRRNAQMVYQNPNTAINDRMTVGRVIREPLDVHDWRTPAERRERVTDLLERVGLNPEHYYRYPHQFSGGQRQRIGIARALALEPDFIVLDEPVSALDVSVQAKILNLLSDLQDEFGLTYMLIAHDLSVVRHICDRVGVMYLGKLMEIGPTEELFRSPANPYTRSLLSAIPQPDPNANGERITLRGTPPNPRHPPTGCVFSTRCPFKIRPEAYESLTDEQWGRLEEFRAVLRERKRADLTLSQRITERLGMSTRFTPIREITEDLFGDIDLPDPVQSRVDEATETASKGAQNQTDDAIRLLDETFGGVCEEEPPTDRSVGESQLSRCHRHRDEHTDPGEYLETRKAAKETKQPN